MFDCRDFLLSYVFNMLFLHIFPYYHEDALNYSEGSLNIFVLVAAVTVVVMVAMMRHRSGGTSNMLRGTLTACDNNCGFIWRRILVTLSVNTKPQSWSNYGFVMKFCGSAEGRWSVRCINIFDHWLSSQHWFWMIHCWVTITHWRSIVDIFGRLIGINKYPYREFSLRCVLIIDRKTWYRNLVSN